MKLKDSLSRKLVELQPTDKPITIYSCGPTVYDYPHIGNWYAFLRWDLLVRTLQASGFKTNWVMNITDVGHLTSDADSGQDKLVAKAQQQAKTAWQVADFYTDYFKQGLKRLNFSPIDALPKATEHIAQQIELVAKLVEAGVTYQIDDGLYVDTSKIANYGQLAGASQPDDQQQARVSPNQQKRQASDFAVWKLSAKDSQRDMEWDSPWGKGFPGWHLECSAMSRHYLGQPIDIHTGGIDHIPVHHSNEIAQSQTAWQQPLARIWLHCNFITVESKKMAKSLNNFYTLEDIEAKHYSPQQLRLACLASHYATAADFSWQLLHEAKQRLLRWQALAVQSYQLTDSPKSDWQKDSFDKAYQAILTSLQNDLNSPEALKHLDALADKVEAQAGELPTSCLQQLQDLLTKIDGLFGSQLSQLPDLTDQQKQLLEDRQAVRTQQDWSTSDSLRQQLADQGIVVHDRAAGYSWSYSSCLDPC